MQSGYQMRRMQNIADAVSARKVDSTRHKCFVSYHVADTDEVKSFLESYGTEFIPRCIGVTEEDDFVDSTDAEYIKRRIREKYLTDSTVTIVLLGKCTWSRKFVDWEVSSSLRNDPNNKRSGLLAIPLPSMNNRAHLPDRIDDNYVADDSDSSYVVYETYPSAADQLRFKIDLAFAARHDDNKSVDNTRSLRLRNLSCP